MSNQPKHSEKPEEGLNDAVREDRQQQKNHRIFVFYIIGLFFVALVLILISYVMQEHANSQLESLGTQLTEQSDAAKGAQARADQLQETVDILQDQLTETQEERDKLESTSEEQTRQIDALDALWQLERAYQLGETATAQELIKKLDEAYTRETLIDPDTAPLTGDAAEEYKSICEEIDD